ncbi:MAG: extracellular solute-binding protein [Ardenticatenales bacterium]|nr:extracellular solute-binding protein [Ardenticatenales bacterium]
MSMVACQGATAPTPEPTTETAAEASPEVSPEASTEASPEASASPEATEEALNLEGSELVIYSGRNEELIGALIEEFEAESGIDVAVRYGDTAEMAATILEEGENSPADLFFAQDAGALGALAQEDRLQALPEEALSLVDARFHDPEGRWVGVSGRARVVVYNTEMMEESELPESILDFTDPQWKGQIGWAPTNGSFQAFVTALRISEGEDGARAWLEGILANEPKVYNNNIAVLEAVAAGEIQVGFINHYYLFRKLAEQGESFPARNHFFANGDIGGLINVAGIGMVDTATHQDAAQAFITFLLSAEAQEYFSAETKEYPLAMGVSADDMLPTLEELETPDIDLNALNDLAGTLDLLQDTGVLE